MEQSEHEEREREVHELSGVNRQLSEKPREGLPRTNRDSSDCSGERKLEMRPSSDARLPPAMCNGYLRDEKCAVE